MSNSSSITQVKSRYFDWLDAALRKVAASKLRGAMICLYENDFFQAQVLGYKSVDPNDVDWASKWDFDEKEIFDFASDRFAADWEEALAKARKWSIEYLASSRDGAKLVPGIGPLALGFADGDIEFLYPEDLKNA